MLRENHSAISGDASETERTMSDELWARRLERENAARWEAERLLEAKSLELYEAKVLLENKLRQISLMLDGSPHGMLTIEQDLTIGAEFSSFLPDLLGVEAEQIAGQNAVELLARALGLDEAAADPFRQTLEISIGENELNWELNCQHLPAEARQTFEPYRTLEIFWTPMIDKDSGVVASALVSLRDVSRERELAKRLQKQDAERNRLMGAIEQLVRAPRSHLTVFFQEADERVARIEKLLQSADGALELLQLDAHSLKGAARTFGFKQLMARIHAFEDALETFPKGRSDCEEAWDWAMAEFGDLRRAFVDVLKGEKVQPRHVAAIVGPHFEATRKALLAEGTAARLRVDDMLGLAPPNLCGVLNEILPLLLSNCVDHSVLPAVRSEAIDCGIIDLEARLESGEQSRVFIALSDNGRGFDLEKIRTRAAERGLEVDESDPLAVVFEPNFSTADAVSDRSGRGVGMTAVRQAVQNAGGEIRLGVGAQGGALIEIQLPVQA